MSSKVEGIKAIPIAPDRLIIRDSEDNENLKEIEVGFLLQTVTGESILEVPTFSALPLAGEANTFYVTIDDGITYRWNGVAYTTIAIPEAPMDSKVYARQNGTWVDPNIGLVSSRIVWEPLSPPQTQLCFVDNVAQVITFTDVPLVDPKISVDLGLGEITILEDLLNMFISINLQITRVSGARPDSSWAFDAEVWDGLAWSSYPDSTRHVTFNKDDADQIKSLGLTIVFDSVPANTKFRFKQITDDASLLTGLISSQPFASMPISPGLLISIGTR